MTLNLAPGLLANASINGGACPSTADLEDSACQVGSGIVTGNLLGTIPVPAQVTFDLVPPPAAGDLAGLAVNANGTQLGSTGDIRIRPSGDPAGVGVTISLVLPNSLSGVPISITEINSTFDALRYPTTCPASPQSFGVTVDSYHDATVQTVSASLSVTGCSSLPYAPAFGVTAVRDRSDRQVTLSTTVSQRAGEAPSRSVSLNSGPHGLFGTTCKPLSGTATATLTDQNGDRTVTAPAKFTVSGCPGAGATGFGPNGSRGGVATAGGDLSRAGVAGLSKGRGSLRSKPRRTKRAGHPHRHRGGQAGGPLPA